jgi:hypothetical protein
MSGFVHIADGRYLTGAALSSARRESKYNPISGYRNTRSLD